MEIVRRGYERFAATLELPREAVTDDFVWDMSTFRGWPERQTYEGVEGAMEFISDWAGAWEGWELTIEELFDAGDKVVAVIRQRGRSKESGVEVDMTFAQVWTMRDGKQARMEMYADVDEGMRAAGLSEGRSGSR